MKVPASLPLRWRLLLPLLFSVILFPSSSSAQHSRIDSLATLLQRPGADTQRVDILCQLSELEASGNPRKSMEHGKEAMLLSEKLHYLHGIIDADISMARCSMRRSEFSTAERYIGHARGVSLKQKNKREFARVLAEEGWLRWMQGDGDRATECFRQGLKLAEEFGLRSELARVLRGVASIHEKYGRLDSAVDCYRKSVKISEELGLKSDIASGLKSLGDCYRKLFRMDQAIDYSRRALEIFEALGDNLTSVVQLCLRLGGCYLYKSQYERALSYCNRGMALIKDRSSSRELGSILNVIGIVHFERGEYDLAKQFFEKSLAQLEIFSDSLEIGNVLVNIGNAYYKLGENDKAMDYHLRGFKIQERVNNPERVKTMLNIANQYVQQGDLKLAENWCLRSLKLSTDIGNQRVVATAYSLLGKIQEKSGGTPKAIEYYQKSLEIYEKLGIPNLIGNACALLGGLFLAQGDFERAKKCFERASSISEEIGDHSSTAEALTRLGEICRMQGQYEPAMQYFQRSVQICQALNDQGGIADNLTAIAEIHIRQRRFDLGLELIRKSMDISRNLVNQYSYCGALLLMGDLQLEQGVHDQALKYYEQVLMISEERHIPCFIANALIGIGRCYTGLGRGDLAFDVLNKGLKAGEQTNLRPTMILALENIGKVLTEKGRLDEAERYLGQAIALGRETGSMELLTSAAKLLASLKARQGDYKRAYEQYQQYAALRDSLINETNIKTISEMNAKYESEKKDDEIKLLEKEKDIKELDSKRDQERLARQEIELARREEQITIQNLTDLRLRQQAKLLEKEKEIGMLELARRTAERDGQISEKNAKQRELNLLHQERELQSTVASGERNLRNALLGGLGLLLVVGFLGVKRIQHKRMEAFLRADAAEYQAKAAEAQAFVLQAENERKEREMQVRFTKSLIESQEQERKRIAGELHDSLGQELLVAKNQLYAIMSAAVLPESYRKRLGDVEGLTGTMLEEVRRISRNLRPIQLDRLGLTETLRNTLAHASSTGSLLLRYDIDDVDGLFAKEEEINVYRILQEGINNLMKHAKARQASVQLKRMDGTVRLSIADDGIGFDAAKVDGGLGLRNMIERVHILHGEFSIDSSPGNGTRIEIRLPGNQSGTSGEQASAMQNPAVREVEHA